MDPTLVSLAENWKDLNPTMVALRVRAILHKPGNIGISEIARALGVSPHTVDNLYRLTFASQDTLSRLAQGEVTRTEVIKEGRKAYFYKVANKGLTPEELAARERVYYRSPQPAAQISEDIEEIPGLPVDTSPSNPLPPAVHLGQEGFRLPGERPAQRNSAVPDLDEIFARFAETVNWSGYVAAKPYPELPGARVKIVSANDFHIPFQHDALIDKLIAEESGDTDLLVIPGDFFDGWNFSRFDKLRRETEPDVEWNKGVEIMGRLAAAFRRVRVMRGNHDERMLKKLLSLPEGQEFITLLKAMFNSKITPLDMVCLPYGNVELIEAVKVEFADFSFLTQIGDLVLGHAEVFSVVPGQAGNRFAHWVHKFAVRCGVVKEPIRVIANGHTHQFANVWGDQSWNIELGCMCRLQSYIASAKIQSPRPPARGYSIFIQDNGVTDMDQYQFKSAKEWIN